MKERTGKIKGVLKQHKGITLIALVVTIVILIILAVISINAVFGENGLISSADRGKVEHTHATVWERIQMAYSDYWAGRVGKEETSLIDYLQDRGIVEDIGTDGVYKINVETLAGTRLALGNGEGSTDVYKLEEVAPGTGSITKVAKTEETIKLAETDEGKTYRVMYYGKDTRENRELGILVDGIKNIVENDNSNFEITKEVTSTPKNGEYYIANEEIEWTITVKNTGKVTMKNIHIPDTLTAGSGTYFPGDEEIKVSSMSEGVSCKNGEFIIDSLEPNGTATIEYTYTVTQGDVEAKEIIINRIGELTGTPKPVIPKGEKLPEVEADVTPYIIIEREVILDDYLINLDWEYCDGWEGLVDDYVSSHEQDFINEHFNGDFSAYVVSCLKDATTVTYGGDSELFTKDYIQKCMNNAYYYHDFKLYYDIMDVIEEGADAGDELMSLVMEAFCEDLYYKSVYDPLAEKWSKQCSPEYREKYELRRTWDGGFPIKGEYSEVLNGLARGLWAEDNNDWDSVVYAPFEYLVTWYDGDGSELSSETISIPFTPGAFNWSSEPESKKISVPLNARSVKVTTQERTSVNFGRGYYYECDWEGLTWSADNEELYYEREVVSGDIFKFCYRLTAIL